MNSKPRLSNAPYVLITAAYNEQAFIEATVQSVIAQTHRPARLIIVSDGSTDNTGEIVRRYAERNECIYTMSLLC